MDNYKDYRTETVANGEILAFVGTLKELRQQIYKVKNQKNNISEEIKIENQSRNATYCWKWAG